jgi:hypothetical protein
MEEGVVNIVLKVDASGAAVGDITTEDTPSHDCTVRNPMPSIHLSVSMVCPLRHIKGTLSRDF